MSSSKKQSKAAARVFFGLVALAVILILVVMILKFHTSVERSENATNGGQTTQSTETSAVSGQNTAESTGASEQTASSTATESTVQTTDVTTTTEMCANYSELPATPWDLATLDTTREPFGYSSNRDENNVPSDWSWYENQWGQFNVDWIQDTSKNVIYLTMDEGYPNDTTATILDTLKEKNVKALFFLTKEFVEGRPDIVQRMIDEGHMLGDHTCTHPDMTTLSLDDATSQIMDLYNEVNDQFGYQMRLFRFPYGAYSSQTLGLANNLGFKVVFWSYAYNDYSEEQPDVQESLQKALDAVHPGAIYLLHASSTTNTAFLGDWIDGCRARGYEFGLYPLDSNY